ncbi:dual specificity mitogen-activated protein kinase kinase 6-like isoform X1 [Mizuhopecten yessoensis]|uniref:mitogen-activated protein kinase kinase n=1 Tax=Mizuhopecten yessoensis TaxID=6573 RepID=A0A0K0WZ94_MIZYE|nr:dual specificity mitogen-activated protein kinase kinase 6-like isoform X1 [Mizuhopecten yessoensis]AKS30505.1 MKK3/6 protein [Mizuhopecten yessoensis]OWF39383.1 Dual specificity mitogen-activated protein kinase kinase 6 [Mizuhopecten yessoensis]
MMPDHLYQHLKVGHESLKTRSHSTQGSNMEPKQRKRRPPGFVVQTPEPPPNPTPPRDLDSKATIKIRDQEFVIEASDLILKRNLGRGAYGVVDEMKHVKSDTILAVKRITVTVNSQEQKRLLMDLDISMRSGSCPYTVTFYGALFREGDVWICMEVMDASLDKFYKKICEKGDRIPEDVVRVIAFSVVKALDYLKKELGVIHRDVKPSNILINKQGQVKICDFGISGYLVDSVAKTMDAGCKPYMAPERINPGEGQRAYDIKSDVWSLGITLIELATGKFPYPSWKTPFEQLKQVVQDPPPNLPPDEFSPEFDDFVKKCLLKDVKYRSNYAELLTHPFVAEERIMDSATLATYVQGVFEKFGDPNETS